MAGKDGAPCHSARSSRQYAGTYWGKMTDIKGGAKKGEGRGTLSFRSRTNPMPCIILVDFHVLSYQRFTN